MLLLFENCRGLGHLQCQAMCDIRTFNKRPLETRCARLRTRETEGLLFLETGPDLARHSVLRGSLSLVGKSYPSKFPGLAEPQRLGLCRKNSVCDPSVCSLQACQAAHLKRELGLALRLPPDDARHQHAEEDRACHEKDCPQRPFGQSLSCKYSHDAHDDDKNS